MWYHFGLGVGHTYTDHQYFDSSSSSNTEESIDINEEDCLHLNENPDTLSELESSSEESLNQSDELKNDDTECNDDEEFFILQEMHGWDGAVEY